MWTMQEARGLAPRYSDNQRAWNSESTSPRPAWTSRCLRAQVRSPGRQEGTGCEDKEQGMATGPGGASDLPAGCLEVAPAIRSQARQDARSDDQRGGQ